MEKVDAVDVSWLHHSQKGTCPSSLEKVISAKLLARTALFRQLVTIFPLFLGGVVFIILAMEFILNNPNLITFRQPYSNEICTFSFHQRPRTYIAGATYPCQFTSNRKLRTWQWRFAHKCTYVIRPFSDEPATDTAKAEERGL